MKCNMPQQKSEDIQYLYLASLKPQVMKPVSNAVPHAIIAVKI